MGCEIASPALTMMKKNAFTTCINHFKEEASFEFPNKKKIQFCNELKCSSVTEENKVTECLLESDHSGFDWKKFLVFAGSG